MKCLFFFQLIFFIFVLKAISSENHSNNFFGFESPKCNIADVDRNPKKHLSPLKGISLSLIQTPENFSTDLKILANSPSVIVGPIGVAGICDKECAAFLSASKKGASLQQELDWMLKNATPAGKLYAAILIRKFDNRAGEQSLISLQSEKTLVSYSSGGCTGGTILPLGEQATRLLKNPNY